MIELPFPSSALAGHSDKHFWRMRPIIAKHREWARLATLAANVSAPSSGDIRLLITFYPPNRRGDRINYPNRMKPFFDGIADALGVNDSRFVPAYQFAEPVKSGFVTVAIVGQS